MNEVLSDFKYLLYNNNTLGGVVNLVSYVDSYREITPTNNRIQTGNININVNVQYSQQGNDPNKIACCY